MAEVTIRFEVDDDAARSSFNNIREELQQLESTQTRQTSQDTTRQTNQRRLSEERYYLRLRERSEQQAAQVRRRTFEAERTFRRTQLQQEARDEREFLANSERIARQKARLQEREIRRVTQAARNALNQQARDAQDANVREERQREQSRRRELANFRATVRERQALRERELREERFLLQVQRRSQEQAARAQERAIRETIQEVRRLQVAQRQMTENALAFGRQFGLAMRAATRHVTRFTVSLVRAAADMETYRATLQAVTNDTAETNRQLRTFLELTIDLVGIDTGDLIQYAARLQATGISAREAEAIITGTTLRIAEQGKRADVTVRVLEQLVQAINANAISMQDFRPILRQMPTLFRDFSEALGTPINNLEQLREAAEDVGGPAEAIILTFQRIAQVARGADPATLNFQLEVLRDSAILLAAEIGDHLIPAIVGVIRHINNLIEWFINLDDRWQSAIAWATAFVTGTVALSAGITTVVVGLTAMNVALRELQRRAISTSGSLVAMNTTLGITGGLSGLGGLGTLLAPAGPIIAGLAAFALALSPILILLRESSNEAREAAQQQRTFADAINNSVQALNNTDNIDTSITALQAYIRTQEEIIANAVTIERLQAAPSRARATFVSGGGFGTANEAQRRIDQSIELLAVLREINSTQDIGLQSLRRAEQVISSALTRARNAGDRESISALENAAEILRGRFLTFYQSVEESNNRVVNATTVFRGTLVQLEDQAQRTNRAFRDSQNIEDLEANYNRARQALEQLAAARERFLQERIAPIRQELVSGISAGTLNENEQQRLREQLRDLGEERIQRELETQRELTQLLQQYTNQRNTFITSARDLRIDAAEQAREVELANFAIAQAAGEDYARTLRELANIQERRAYVALIDRLQEQGQSFFEAQVSAQAYIGALRGLQEQEASVRGFRPLRSNSAEFERLTNVFIAQGLSAEQAQQRVEAYITSLTALERIQSRQGIATPAFTLPTDFSGFLSGLREVNTATGDLVGQFQNLIDRAREFINIRYRDRFEIAQAENDAREQQEFAEPPRGQTLESLQQDARSEGLEFVRRLNRRQERELRQSLSRQYRHYRTFADQVTNVFTDLAAGREVNFETVALSFLTQSIRMIARAFIEAEIQKRIDQEVTNFRIANINRLAAAQQQASQNAVALQQNLSSILPGLGNIPGLGFLNNLQSLLSGGGIALGASAALFPNQSRNLTSGITNTIGEALSNVSDVLLGSGPEQVGRSILVQIGENEARDISDLQDGLRDDNRL